MVDGGFDYMRVGYKDQPEYVEVYVIATKKELYDDWNKNINKFGTIKNELTEGKKKSRVKDDDGK
jgi:hypothetical protein